LTLDILDSLPSLFNPESIIRYGGITLLLVVIFMETGVFFGFFLPGDSLVFVAGLLAESEYLDINVYLLWPLLIVAAASGSMVGYWFGSRAGNYLAHRRENFFYKKKYLDMTRGFYDKYGMWAFIMGRFLPIIRTFVPIFAGLAHINYNKFILFNIIGAAIWISTMLFAGYGLGNLFPSLADHLGIIVLGMVIVTAIPVMVAWLRQRRIFKGQR
jgi:membrane-associated protein